MNTIISLVCIKRFPVYLLEPLQNNLNNPEAYFELCQTSKMGCFAKTFKTVNYFHKTFPPTWVKYPCGLEATDLLCWNRKD